MREAGRQEEEKHEREKGYGRKLETKTGVGDKRQGNGNELCLAVLLKGAHAA